MAETRIETYIPLYRKYRPQTFADLVGQEAICQTLGNAISLNKVAHAYLFCGPRGTGKTSAARIFAKSLNCEQGPSVTPCLQCAVCVGITQGNALDVVEFDAASHTGVDKARELIENVQYTAMSGRFKIYIIDEVHMLSTASFNALLKTLEEPPPNVIFVFATTEAHKVLPTIISRCQRFDFNRITLDNIVARLHYIARQEAIAIDEEAVLMIARHARGGLRDAVGLLDQVAVLGRAQQDKVIGRKDVAMFIGTLEEDLLLRLSKAIAQRQSAELLHELSELLHRGIEPVQLLKDLTGHFRNLLLVQAAGAGADPEQLSLPPDYYGQLAEQVALFPEAEEIPQILVRLSFVERNVRNSTQPQLWLEVGLLELAYRHEIQLVKELSERVARLEAQLANGATIAPPVGAPVQTAPAQPAMAMPQARPSMPPETPKTPTLPPSQASSVPPRTPAMPPPQASAVPMKPIAATPASPGTGAPADLTLSFTQICNSVASLPTRALLQQQAFALSMENDVLTVGCSSEPTLNLLKKPEKLIHLQKAAEKFYGRPIRIELLLEKKPTGMQPALPPAPPPAPMPPSQPEPVAVAPAVAVPPVAVPEPIETSSASAPEALSIGSVEPALALTPALGTPVSEAPGSHLPEAGMELGPKPEQLEPSVMLEVPPSPTAGSAQEIAFEPSEALNKMTSVVPEMALDTPPAVGLVTTDAPPVLGAEMSFAPDEGRVDPDLAEAKQHAMQLLQGKLLD